MTAWRFPAWQWRAACCAASRLAMVQDRPGRGSYLAPPVGMLPAGWGGHGHAAEEGAAALPVNDSDVAGDTPRDLADGRSLRSRSDASVAAGGEGARGAIGMTLRRTRACLLILRAPATPTARRDCRFALEQSGCVFTRRSLGEGPEARDSGLSPRTTMGEYWPVVIVCPGQLRRAGAWVPIRQEDTTLRAGSTGFQRSCTRAVMSSQFRQTRTSGLTEGCARAASGHSAARRLAESGG